MNVAHLSREAFADTYAVAVQKGNYPLLYSHAHLWNTISSSEKKNEKYIRDSEIPMITAMGGMVGLRPGPEETVAYAATGRTIAPFPGGRRSRASTAIRA